MEVTKRQDLQRKIKQAVSGDEWEEELPLTITYCEGFGFLKYEITIKVVDEDSFVDSRGIKWVKAKE